jgi:hypothetical protein
VAAPLAAIVPTAEFPLAMPFTSHAMVAPAARQNDALKVCVCARPTLADVGDIELAVPHVIITVALADFVVSATLVAVTVTVGGVGTVAGAV